jgi:hypothetical protein
MNDIMREIRIIGLFLLMLLSYGCGSGSSGEDQSVHPGLPAAETPVSSAPEAQADALVPATEPKHEEAMDNKQTEPAEKQTTEPTREKDESQAQAERESAPVEVTEPRREDASDSIILSIRGEHEKVGIILEAVEVKLEKEETVLEVLKRITRQHKMPMEYRGGSGALAYVEGINNVYEFDFGPESGWTYTVNGDQPNKSAGSYSLNSGDVVEWVYVVKDLDQEKKEEEK